MKFYPFINIQIHILIALTIFSMPIVYFAGVKVYQLIIISIFISTIILLIKKILHKESIRPGIMKAINLYLFIVFIVFGFLSGLFQNGSWKAFLGSIEYLIFFGLFLLLAFLDFPFRRYMNGLIINLSIAAFIVGLLGVYQYFIDSDLFGLYADSVVFDINSWSVKRVPSILGSIQVFAGFMTYVILLLFIFKPFPKSLNFIIILSLVSMGFFSGSYLFYGSVFLIFLGLMIENKKTFGAFICIFTCIFILLLIFEEVQMTFGPVIRLVTIFNLDSEFNASNSERFSIWLDVLRQTPFLYGNGFGQASMLVDGIDRFNTESYFFSVFYQTGLLGSLIMFLLFTSLIFSASRGLPWVSKIIIILIVTAYFLGVHIFYSIMMLPFWLLMIQTKKDY